MKKATLLIAAGFLFFIEAQSQKDSLQEYTGKYIFPEGSIVPSVDVTLEDTVLTMSSEAGSSIITREGKDTFYIVEFNGIAIFKRDSDNKINAVHIEAGGYILDGKKEQKGGVPSALHILQKNKPAFLRKEKV